MRAVPLLVSGLVGGIIVGVVLFVGNLVEIRVEIRRAPTETAAESPPIPSPDTLQSTHPPTSAVSSTSPFGDQGSVALLDSPRDLIDRANKLIAAGQLHEAHELYLQGLLVDPDEQEAMRGLVRARRIKAGNNPAVLRQQANNYEQAISQGADTGEHYTPVAMDLLAKASLLAAAELEGSSDRASASVPPPVTGPPSSPPDTRPTVSLPSPSDARPAMPTPRIVAPKPQSAAPLLQPARPAPITTKAKPIQPKSQSQSIRTAPGRSEPRAVTSKPQRASPETQRASRRKSREDARLKAPRRPVTLPAPARPPEQKRPAPPAPLTVDSGPVDMNEPFVTITVGPITSGAQASSITSELTVAGHVARMRRGGAVYVITMGPYRRSMAERIASRIRSRFGQGIPVSLDPSS